MIDKNLQHDINHSLAIISRLSQSIHPIVSRMSEFFLNTPCEQIASKRQIEITHEAMLIIKEEAEKLLHFFEEIQKIK